MKVLKDDNESEDFVIKLSTIMLDFVDLDDQLAEIDSKVKSNLKTLEEKRQIELKQIEIS